MAARFSPSAICKIGCKNGGTCMNPFSNECRCPQGYIGAYCEKRKWYCNEMTISSSCDVITFHAFLVSLNFTYYLLELLTQQYSIFMLDISYSPLYTILVTSSHSIHSSSPRELHTTTKQWMKVYITHLFSFSISDLCSVLSERWSVHRTRPVLVSAWILWSSLWNQ